MKIYLDSIGCRLNQAEIEQYAREFRAAGHCLVANPSEADLAVLNTCAVTSAAVSDSRQKVRQLAHLGVEEIAVTGCWATLKPREAAALPAVKRVVLNRAKDKLVSDMLGIPAENFDLEPVERQPIPGARLRTRAFIKVQDGCDNRCTFCVTRLARGPGRSRPIAHIMSDIYAACRLENPYRAQEIVLTGVNLGSWGQDFASPLTLRHLVQAILAETDVPRVRLSSLEPWELDASFLQLWDNPRLCRHLHLPLQSGSAATLQRMARKTTPESFAELVATARVMIPGIAITTDLICGFPGEDEIEFAECLEYVRQMHFAGGHVFTFSARPGTAATRMPDTVPAQTKKERNAILRDALAESAQSYRSAFLGQALSVLWENAAALGPEGWKMSGLTDNFLRVNAHTPQHLWNKITPVRLSQVIKDGFYGQIQAP